MVTIDAHLVATLVADQYPQWAGWSVAPVDVQGWDNRTFRLGEDLAVRLPSAPGYVAGVEKENRWLPELARHLPLPVPTPVATGRPGSGYPFPWSVRRWLPGDTVAAAPEVDRVQLAADLGDFLRALRSIPLDGPAAGPHSAYRGCHPSVYGEDVERVLSRLADRVDVVRCRAVWAEALTSAWPSAPVWFHGDVAVGNLLCVDGRLSAVIDFGTCGTGDPACDLVMAWNYFTGSERTTFRQASGLDDDTWRRARGWALWKALITLAHPPTPDGERLQRRVLADVLREAIVEPAPEGRR